MLRAAATKRKRGDNMEAGGAEGNDAFDAVSLDFLFGMDAWLLAGEDALPPLIGDATPALSPFSPGLAGFSGFPVGDPVVLPPSAPKPLPELPLLSPLAPATARQTPTTTQTAAPARKKAKPNKSTSQRQKEELVFLRAKVEELEGHLGSLKSSQLQTGSEEESKPDASGTTTQEVDGGLIQVDESDDAALWERIAKRQQEEKAKAEVENVKLREMVEGQIKLVRSFERLLRKRQVWDQLQEDKWQKNVTPTKNDEEIFDELSQSIDARRHQIDAIFETHGLDDASAEGGDANLKFSPVNGIYIEFKDTKFLPFGFRMIDEVMWRSIRQGKLKVVESSVKTVKETEDFVMSKATIKKSPDGTTPTFAWSICKRYATDRSIEYVYESSMLIAGSSEAAHPFVKLLQQGWGRIAPTKLRDGSTGSVLQSYSVSIPTVLETEQTGQLANQQQHREIDILTELIFTSYKQSRQTLHQTIENLVLDEALSRGAAT